jgi:hypothetical protein
MRKMTCRFLIPLVLVVLVACGSKSFRGEAARGQGSVLDFAIERERARVLPHLHYSLGVSGIGRRCGTVELSFYFVKEQGDTLLWVECVERVPLALVDTALCRRWFCR